MERKRICELGEEAHFNCGVFNLGIRIQLRVVIKECIKLGRVSSSGTFKQVWINIQAMHEPNVKRPQ